MRAAFGPAALVTGYEHLVPSMRNDPKDRHVLAAAVHAEAAVIVTANLDDFKKSAIREVSPELLVQHPDEFLVDLLDAFPEDVPVIVRNTQQAYLSSPVGWDKYLAQLEVTVPRFVAAIRGGSVSDS
jgi:hypothetical protein